MFKSDRVILDSHDGLPAFSILQVDDYSKTSECPIRGGFSRSKYSTNYFQLLTVIHRPTRIVFAITTCSGDINSRESKYNHILALNHNLSGGNNNDLTHNDCEVLLEFVLIRHHEVLDAIFKALKYKEDSLEEAYERWYCDHAI